MEVWLASVEYIIQVWFCTMSFLKTIHDRLFPIQLVSMEFVVPSTKPFDAGNWFETLVGQIVVPIVNSGKVRRYWFTRYQSVGGKTALFRFYTNDVKGVERHAKKLAGELGIGGGVADLSYTAGEISAHPRFLGTNQRQNDENTRKELIWDFLHATAVLFLDCLSSEDGDGRWSLEINQDGLNCSTGETFEAFHHMFSNITGFEPPVFELQEPGLPRFLSPMYFYGNYQAQIAANVGAQRHPFDGLPVPVTRFRVKF